MNKMNKFVFKMDVDVSIEADNEEEAKREINKWLSYNYFNSDIVNIEASGVPELRYKE